MDNTDPSITFSPGWSQLGPYSANSTEATNAFANISFIGIQLEWTGIILGTGSHAPSSAVYSVDEGPLMQFTLVGLPSNISNSTDFFNVPVLTTGVLQQGPHTLFVRFLGNDDPIDIVFLVGYKCIRSCYHGIVFSPNINTVSVFNSSFNPPV